jgi:hypothetical protein
MLLRSLRIVGTALLLFVSGSGEPLSAGEFPHVAFAGAVASRVVMARPMSATRPVSTAMHDAGQLVQARPSRERPLESTASTAADAPQITGSPAASAPFTDDPLAAGDTAVKAIHVTELRTRVDAARTGYGLSPWPWTDPTLVPGVTVVKALHIQELRTALAAVYSAAGRTLPTWSVPTIVRGATVIAATQIAELRSAVSAISVTRPTQFGPGQYLVGRDIAPGRYYSDPAYGCYWERQSGLSGSLADIIANDFVGFDSLQVVVDVRSTDLAFQADAECGTWYSTPRQGFQATIRPGTWLVGGQIRSGTYRAATSDGCYWERLRGFTGELSAIIANDFVSGGGVRYVSIAAGDAGFHTDADCGAWTLVSALSTTAYSNETPSEQPRSDVERFREMNRKQHGWSRIPTR